MLTLTAYRGHIRNHKALCETLGIDDALSREAREEAILLAAYRAWGAQMGLHLHGMFAAAIYDDETDTLFCVRDPFGTKPFYYYETADGRLLYGTTIREIMAKDGFVKELNDKMLQIYLTMTYTTGEETFFKGLKKLLPGRTMTYHGGECRIERYWRPTFAPDESKTLDEWADEIDADRAASSMKRAQKILAKKDASDTELRLAEARLKRALIRRSVAQSK